LSGSSNPFNVLIHCHAVGDFIRLAIGGIFFEGAIGPRTAILCHSGQGLLFSFRQIYPNEYPSQMLGNRSGRSRPSTLSPMSYLFHSARLSHRPTQFGMFYIPGDLLVFKFLEPIGAPVLVRVLGITQNYPTKVLRDYSFIPASVLRITRSKPHGIAHICTGGGAEVLHTATSR
jgi:hypothetical protein